jgi:hypothetical protein
VKRQPSRTPIGLQQPFYPGFVDRRHPTLKRRNTLLISIHARNPITHFGKTGSRHQTNIAASNNRDLHARLLNDVQRGLRHDGVTDGLLHG